MTSRAARTGGDADAVNTSVNAYESLRTHVLTGSTRHRPTGLLVLLRQGVTAWRARRSTCSGSVSAATRTPTPPLAGDWHAAVARVLVNMVMTGHQEVRV